MKTNKLTLNLLLCSRKTILEHQKSGTTSFRKRIRYTNIVLHYNNLCASGANGILRADICLLKPNIRKMYVYTLHTRSRWTESEWDGEGKNGSNSVVYLWVGKCWWCSNEWNNYIQFESVSCWWSSLGCKWIGCCVVAISFHIVITVR